MHRLSLPCRNPFGDVMTFYLPHLVELCMDKQTLKRCQDWEQRIIDLYARDVTTLPGDVLMFTYTRRRWLFLCDDLHTMKSAGEPLTRYAGPHVDFPPGDDPRGDVRKGGAI